MADSQPPQAPAGSQGQNRGGRRRGRGGANQKGQAESQRDSNVGAFRGYRGRGRGGRGGGDRNRNTNASQGAVANAPAEGEEKPKKIPEATDDADDGEICFICASDVTHTSVSPCNHRTCHICALRLRALYKNKACAHCRVCCAFTKGTLEAWLTDSSI